MQVLELNHEIVNSLPIDFCVCDYFSRPVVNAEVKKVWLLAAAHLQRSRGPAADVPLSAQPKTRYFVMASRFESRAKSAASLSDITDARFKYS